jgi:hypothetical protein
MSALHIIIAIQGLALLISLGLIIFLIARRIKIKKTETFEKRQN